MNNYFGGQYANIVTYLIARYNIKNRSRVALGKIYRHYMPIIIQNKIDVSRVIPYWEKYGVGFIHIPKTAGVSISMAVYGKKLPHVRAVSAIGIVNVPTFCVLRDPYERFLSAYNSILLGGTDDAVPNFSTYYAVRQSLSIEKFISEWLTMVPYNSIDMAFHRQVDWVCDQSGNFLVDHFFNYPQIETVNEYIRSLGLETPDVLPTLNMTSSWPVSKLLPKERGLIDKFYAQDFELISKLSKR